MRKSCLLIGILGWLVLWTACGRDAEPVKDNPEIQKAIELIETGWAENAIPVLPRVLAASPEDTRAHLVLARAYRSEGYRRRAIYHLWVVTELAPFSTDAEEALAELETLGAMEALGPLEELTEEAPGQGSFDILPLSEVEIFALWLLVGMYFHFCFCLRIIAHKTRARHASLAWIPIANLYLLCKVAHKPGVCVIFLLIPGLNIVVWLLLWMAIAQRLGHPPWGGLMMGIPVLALLMVRVPLAFPLLNLVILSYLTFTSPAGEPGTLVPEHAISDEPPWRPERQDSRRGG